MFSYVVPQVFEITEHFFLFFDREQQAHRNVDDLIFDMFQDKDEDVVLVGKFLAVS